MPVEATAESTEATPQGEHYFELDWVDIEGLPATMIAYPMLKFQVLTDYGPGGGNFYIGITGPLEDCKRMYLDEEVYGQDFIEDWDEFYSKPVPIELRWPPGQTVTQWRAKLDAMLAY